MDDAPQVVRLFNLLKRDLDEALDLTVKAMCNQQSSLMQHEWLRGKKETIEQTLDVLREKMKKVVTDE